MLHQYRPESTPSLSGTQATDPLMSWPETHAPSPGSSASFARKPRKSVHAGPGGETHSGPLDGTPGSQIQPLHEAWRPSFPSCSTVTGDVAESPLMGRGRADVQPQFPQLQNAPEHLVQCPGLHVCGIRAHTHGSVDVDIIQEPRSQLAWLLMQQEFTAATGLRGEEEAGAARFDKWLLFTRDWQTNAPRCAANHLKITAHMFPLGSVPC